MPKTIFECRGKTIEVATDTTEVEISIADSEKGLVTRLTDEQVYKLTQVLTQALYERNY